MHTWCSKCQEMDCWTQLILRRPKVSYVIHISEHVHTFWISRFFMCALKLLSSNVACASCLFLFKNHKFHMRQKRMPKLLKTQMLAMCTFYCKLHMKLMTTENVMLHLHGKKPMQSTFFQKTHAFLEFWTIFSKKLEQKRNHY